MYIILIEKKERRKEEDEWKAGNGWFEKVGRDGKRRNRGFGSEGFKNVFTLIFHLFIIIIIIQ